MAAVDPVKLIENPLACAYACTSGMRKLPMVGTPAAKLWTNCDDGTEPLGDDGDETLPSVFIAIICPPAILLAAIWLLPS
jgi:hypothetical protein